MNTSANTSNIESKNRVNNIITEAEGIEVGGFVKINTDGRTAIVTGIGLVSEGHGVVLYLDDFTNWCQDCREKNGYNIIKTSDEVTPLTEDDYKPKADIKDDYKKGDRVRHNQSGRVATIEAVRVTREMKVFGEYRKVYRLNFGESVPGPFGTELNGGEFIAEAITLESASEITEQREQNDACISSAESRRDKANGQITDGAKKESFGKMFIYRLYIKWKWMQQRFERIGDMDRAAYCFYHRLRLTKLYIYQPGWRIMDYSDMKPIFFPRQRIK